VTNVDPSLEQFLSEHPLRSRWLDDLINALLEKTRGTAHVQALVRELWGGHDINEIEATITRRINDYCSNAADFDRPIKYDLFERVSPATYRLRSYPQKPDTLELVRIEFEDIALQHVWKFFCETYGKHPSWEKASAQRRLLAFAKAMGQEKWLSLYSSYKASAVIPIDLSAIDL